MSEDINPQSGWDNELIFLQHEKLKAEIKSLNKPIFKRIEFYSLLVPLIIGALTLYYLNRNGTFDFNIAALKLEKENLHHDINDFENEKKNLKEDSLKLRSQNIAMEQKLKSDSVLLDNINSELNKLKNSIEPKQKQIIDLTIANAKLDEIINKMKADSVMMFNQNRYLSDAYAAEERLFFQKSKNIQMGISAEMSTRDEKITTLTEENKKLKEENKKLRALSN